jgi:AP-2 complex subunit beta-1
MTCCCGRPLCQAPPSDANSALMQRLLAAATKVDNPDVRSRAYFYWHLLSQDIEAAKSVVLATKPILMAPDGQLVEDDEMARYAG